jgi:VanZ family protein
MPTILPAHRWLLFTGYTLALGAACLVPAATVSPLTSAVTGLDLAAHFILFGLHAVLFLFALSPTRRAGPILAGAVALTVGYGVLIEIMQPTIGGEGRTFQWADIAANSLGAILFTGGARPFMPRFPNQTPCTRPQASRAVSPRRPGARNSP